MAQSASPYGATDRLAELIRKKRQVLLQLRDIGLREAGTVETCETTQLLQLATAKQHLVTALQMIERGLAPYHQDDPEARAWRTPQDRAHCAAESAECRTLLAEVVALEKQQEQAMCARRDAMALQLREANQAQRAASAYRQHRTDRSHTPLGPRVIEPTLASQLDLSSESRTA